MEKNQQLTLRIETLGTEGEGISHVDGYTLFLKDAAPGDLVQAVVTKVGKTYGYARVLDILEPSADRISPCCPLAKRCGGCTLQHIAPAAEDRFKEQRVRDCLHRIGGFSEELLDAVMEPIIGIREDELWHYSNKAQFPVGARNDDAGQDAGMPEIGFYAARSHEIIDLNHCYIQCEEHEDIIRILRSYMQAYRIQGYDEQSGKGLIRHLMIRKGFRSGEIGICLVLNRDADHLTLPHGKELVDMLRGTFPQITSICLNANPKKTNVIFGEGLRVLYGEDYITDMIGDLTFRISPLSFFQVNPRQMVRLYQTALEFAGLTGQETVWDLYCGIGTISLFLARSAAHVYGVEIVPEAIRNARLNAEENHILNADFSVGAAEDVAPELPKPDVIVVDPPRKGCDAKLLDTILDYQPERIVYVSCDPATLARDLKILAAGGYDIRRVRPCNMFPRGGHIECVTLLQRMSNTREQSFRNIK